MGVALELLGGLVPEEFHGVPALDQRLAFGGEAFEFDRADSGAVLFPLAALLRLLVAEPEIRSSTILLNNFTSAEVIFHLLGRYAHVTCHSRGEKRYTKCVQNGRSFVGFGASTMLICS